MTEDFVQYLWRNGLYKSNTFLSRFGKTITILNVGQWNRNSGPDFFNGRIRIDDITLAGNIEIHLFSSDWYKHQHHLDANYDNVILSVVIEDDIPIYTSKGRMIDTITLDYAESLYTEYKFMNGSTQLPRCCHKLKNIDNQWFTILLHSLYIERLERKYKEIETVLKQLQGDWGTCFYRLLCRYWGGNVNADAFTQLAMSLPYRMLLKHADQPLQLEALLYGTSGLLNDVPIIDEYMKQLKKEWNFLSLKYQIIPMQATQWKFMRIRPDAFPSVRLALLASFIPRLQQFMEAIFSIDNIDSIITNMQAVASSYWNQHYQMGETSQNKPKLLGRDLKYIITINALIPFLFTYGKFYNYEKYKDKALRWINEIPAESNYITKLWSKYGQTLHSALESQATIQLYNEYCLTHRCLYCSVGRKLFTYSL